MSQSVKYTRSVQSDGTPSLSGSGTEVGTVLSDVNETLPVGENGIALSFTTAALQYVFMVADQDTDVLTNSSSTPDDTLQLKAGRPLEWAKGDGYFACPFTQNVSAIYVSPSVASRFKLRVLYN